MPRCRSSWSRLPALRRADARWMQAKPAHVLLYELYRRSRRLRPASGLRPLQAIRCRARATMVSRKTVASYKVDETLQAAGGMTSRGLELLALFGTDEPVAARRLLTAGPLSAILEDGNLRTICFGGVEAVRAINYLARDGSWGTYKAVQSNLEITESDSSFVVTYDALCSGSNGRFAYRMTITGEASGRLTMEAVGEALTDFPTNRTGFVVLHPSEAAGGRLTIRHSDGGIEQTVFPEAISRRPAGLRHRCPDPRARAGRLLHGRDGRRCLRDGGSAQLGGRILQDLYPPAVQAASLYHRQGPKGSPADHRYDQRSSRSQAGNNGRRCQAHTRSANWPDAVDGPVPRSGRAAVRRRRTPSRSARRRTSSFASIPIAGMIGGR